MSDLVTFDTFEAELNRETVVQREIRAEQRAAIVLRCTTYQDVFAPQWRHMARKVTAQWNQWIKSGEGPDQEELALCLNARGHLAAFRDYIFAKTAKKPQENLMWEEAFSDLVFTQNVLFFIYQKSFEAKMEVELSGRTAFATQIGLEYFVRQAREKQDRSLIHEAINRVSKLQGQGVLTDDAIRMVTSAMRETLREQNMELARMLARQRFAQTDLLQLDDDRYFALARACLPGVRP